MSSNTAFPPSFQTTFPPRGLWKAHEDVPRKRCPRPTGHLYLALEDREGTPILAGDYVLLAWSPKMKELRPHIRGSIYRLKRAAYPKLREKLNCLQYVDDSWSGWHGQDLDRLRRFLDHRSALLGRDSTSRIFVIRPLVSLEAGSDDVALAKLLSQVGGRMPSA